jgi:uncharacterized protein YndB with AHSA1/START domain
MLATQLFVFDVRESDSPFVEQIWRTKSVPVEAFMSVAVPQWEMVVTRQRGDQHRGYWEVLEADAPHRLVFRDGFANADGTPNTDLPLTTARVRIEEIGQGRTRMSIESVFPSAEAMEQVLAMGMEEGLTQAVGQIDAILAEDAFARP